MARQAGSLPLPRYKLSPWTTLRQEPIESILDDEKLKELFGFRRNCFCVLDDESRLATPRVEYLSRYSAELQARRTIGRLDSWMRHS